MESRMNMDATEDENVDSNSVDLTTISDACASGHQSNEEFKTTFKIWKNFERTYVNGKVAFGVCRFCDKKLDCQTYRGISTLVGHLKRCAYKTNKKQQTLSFSPIQSGSFGDITNWEFDEEACRKALAHMIFVEGLPFKFVEGKGFKDFCQVAQPMLGLISRTTLMKDCFELYQTEKRMLANMFVEKVRCICLTTDTWTSVQNAEYLCLTAHYVDTNWKLQKRVINFRLLPWPHTSKAISECIENCLDEWKIKQICTITVDNALSNDVAVQILKRNFKEKGGMLGGGEFFHVQCVTHTINLIVKDVMNEENEYISRIRNILKYVMTSVTRQQYFDRLVEDLKVPFKSSLCLDVETHWNSTFFMLQNALKFKKVFACLEVEDSQFLSEGAPNEVDWENARVVCLFLEHFYAITKVLSQSTCTTANQYFVQLAHIQTVLNDLRNEEDPLLHDMCQRMKEKLNKYWSSIDNINMLLIIAIVLDPRYKLDFVEFCCLEFLDKDTVDEIIGRAKDTLVKLFSIYQAEQSSVPTIRREGEDEFYFQFRRWQAKERIEAMKTEVERYLKDSLEKSTENFDVLSWWAESSTYRTLSYLAKDILAIPVSTVTSESAFSIGRCALDPYRSSLTPDLVECLICAQDWLRLAPKPTEDEENIEDLEKLVSGNENEHVLELGLEGIEERN